MDDAAIHEYILSALPGVEVVDAQGATFFFDGPDHRFPFATIVRTDAFDEESDLSRPGVFRLNVGVGKETFRSLFGEAGADAEHDYKQIDRIQPHPVYGKMYWVCVLNPSPETFESVRPLLAEAHEIASRRGGKGGD